MPPLPPFFSSDGAPPTQAVAGKIAHTCRDADPPAALCIGATSINQAVKAISVARGYLVENNMDLAFQPVRACVRMYMGGTVSR